jgi:hypothetical protein
MVESEGLSDHLNGEDGAGFQNAHRRRSGLKAPSSDRQLSCSRYHCLEPGGRTFVRDRHPIKRLWLGTRGDGIGRHQLDTVIPQVLLEHVDIHLLAYVNGDGRGWKGKVTTACAQQLALTPVNPVLRQRPTGRSCSSSGFVPPRRGGMRCLQHSDGDPGRHQDPGRNRYPALPHARRTPNPPRRFQICWEGSLWARRWP